jgi:AbrB family looped-hinge helix DNA binding protein
MANGILNGMTVSVDKAGRIVLPKKLRDRFRLHAGSELEIVPGKSGLELRPVEQKSAMKRVGNRWVHQGVPQRPVENAVEEMRDERIAELIRRTGLE